MKLFFELVFLVFLLLFFFFSTFFIETYCVVNKC